jgi:RecA-family ATPase
VKHGPVEFITAEDSADELHRRAANIVRETRQALSAFDGVHVASFADEHAIMAALNGAGQLIKTGFYDEVVEIVAETKPVLLVLDTLADIFAGNEIIRAQVRAFVNISPSPTDWPSSYWRVTNRSRPLLILKSDPPIPLATIADPSRLPPRLA